MLHFRIEAPTLTEGEHSGERAWAWPERGTAWVWFSSTTYTLCSVVWDAQESHRPVGKWEGIRDRLTYAYDRFS